MEESLCDFFQFGPSECDRPLLDNSLYSQVLSSAFIWFWHASRIFCIATSEYVITL